MNDPTAIHSTEPAPEPADAEATAPAPTIVLRFAGPGAADCAIALDRVTPGQVMAAAWFLDAYARELRSDSLRAQPQLVRATPADLATRARARR